MQDYQGSNQVYLELYSQTIMTTKELLDSQAQSTHKNLQADMTVTRLGEILVLPFKSGQYC